MGHDHHAPVADAGIPTDRAVVLVHDSAGARPGQVLRPQASAGWLGHTTPTRAPGHADGRAAAADEGVLYREHVWHNTDEHDRGEWSLLGDNVLFRWIELLFRLPRVGEVALERADDRDPEVCSGAASAVLDLSRLYRHFALGLLLPFWCLRVLVVLCVASVSARMGVTLTDGGALPADQIWPAIGMALVLYVGVGAMLRTLVRGWSYEPADEEDGGGLPHNPWTRGRHDGLLASLFWFVPGMYLVTLARMGAIEGSLAPGGWIDALNAVGWLAHFAPIVCFLGVIAICLYQRLATLNLGVERSLWGAPMLAVGLSWLLLEFLLFVGMAAAMLLVGWWTGLPAIELPQLVGGGLVVHGTQVALVALGFAAIAYLGLKREPGYAGRARCRAMALATLLIYLWPVLDLTLRGADPMFGGALASRVIGREQLALLVIALLVGYLLLIAFLRPVIEGVGDMASHVGHRAARGDASKLFAEATVDSLRDTVKSLIAAGHDRVLVVGAGHGGVIAYDMLRDFDAAGARVELVTAGAPLESLYTRFLPEAMYPTELPKPRGAAAWHHVWLENDLLASELSRAAVDDQQSLGYSDAGYLGDERMGAYLRQLLRERAGDAEFAAPETAAEPVGAAG